MAALPNSPAYVVASLPPLEWRGLTAPPYEVVTASWSHDQAPRGVPYIDADGHDWTGRKSFEFTARLFFLNTIGEGTLYPDAWEAGGWKDALLDGSADTLQHPILGPVLARVVNAKTEIRANVLGGIIVDVSFVESVDDFAGPQGLIAPSVDAGTLAAAADIDAAVFGVTYAQFKKKQSTLLEAWTAIKSGVFSLTLSVDGQIKQLMASVATMHAQLDAQNVAENIAAQDNLVALWTSLKSASDKIAAANRPTARKVLRQDMTLDAFAASVNNQLIDVMGLNLQALRKPIISRGTTLTYYIGR